VAKVDADSEKELGTRLVTVNDEIIIHRAKQCLLD